MILSSIAKIKARTIFAGVIYGTWSACVVYHMFSKGTVPIPTEVNMAFIAVLSHFFGERAARKMSEVK